MDSRLSEYKKTFAVDLLPKVKPVSREARKLSSADEDRGYHSTQ